MLLSSICGSIENPPLVFLHGFLGSAQDWDPVIEQLESDFFCLAIHLPGHGSSFSSDFSSALEKRVLLHGIKSCTLIGYSMGGRLALSAMRQLPLTFPKVIAISADPGIAGCNTAKAAEELKWERLLKTAPFEKFLELWYEQPLFSSLKKKKELFTEMLERRKKQDPRTLAAALRLFSQSRLKPASTIPREAFFICGEEDLKYRELYTILLAADRFVTIPNCGHALHLEDPLACAQAIRKFATTLEPSCT
ncbi:MAG: alpha/beta fold hydrolase [Chlamydiales bacterium]|nr:alpha/beta fold hydrolase [Chlamydiales bacterium]